MHCLDQKKNTTEVAARPVMVLILKSEVIASIDDDCATAVVVPVIVMPMAVSAVPNVNMRFQIL